MVLVYGSCGLGGFEPDEFMSDLHSTRQSDRRLDPATPPGAVDVLVVDDDESIRASVAAILQRSGYSVRVAKSAEEALELLPERSIGMMLLDLRMPGIGGLGLLRTADILPPVVIVSAFVLSDTELEHLAGRVFAQLEKPFDPRHLLDVVAEALKGPTKSC